MKKNIIKIILDVLLAAVMILMYNANVLTLSFHEIGGLILIGVFFIHIALSPKWVASTTRKLLSRSLPARARLNYIIDFLLLVCVAVIGVSGIMISRVVFAGSNDLVWTAWHYFASALALALVGVHIGSHWAFIKCMFGKVVKLPKAFARALGIILIAAILAYGGYSITSSSFLRWLSSPFTASLRYEVKEFDKGQLSQLPPKSGVTLPQTSDGTFENSEKGGIDFKGKEGGLNDFVKKDSESVPEVIAAYGSIVGLFAIVTALIVKLLKKKKKAAAKNAEVTPQTSSTE